jgi:HEAT repeat protein
MLSRRDMRGFPQPNFRLNGEAKSMRRKNLIVSLLILAFIACAIGYALPSLDLVKLPGRSSDSKSGSAAIERNVDSLISALNHKDGGVRCRAVELLGVLSDPRSVEPLLNALKDTDGKVRSAATVSLGRLKDPRAAEPLKTALGSEKDVVRQRVIKQALDKIEESKQLTTTGDKNLEELKGDLVSSHPRYLLVIENEGEAPEVVKLKVGLKTKFTPVRRPAKGEETRVKYQDEHGIKFAYEVLVTKPLP